MATSTRTLRSFPPSHPPPPPPLCSPLNPAAVDGLRDTTERDRDRDIPNIAPAPAATPTNRDSDRAAAAVNPPPTPRTADLRLETSFVRDPETSASQPERSSPPSSSSMARSSSYLGTNSPASATSAYSPSLNPITKMTPLPSPLVGSDSPGPWHRVPSRPVSRTPSLNQRHTTPPRSRHTRGDSVIITSTGEPLDVALAAQYQRKALESAKPQHPSSGTVSAPPQSFSAHSLAVPKVRNHHEPAQELPNLSPTGWQYDLATQQHHLTREKCLARRRRTISSGESSPALEVISGSGTSISSLTSDTSVDTDSPSRTIKKQKLVNFKAKGVRDGRIRHWRGLRLLGQGVFSKVILATSEDIPEEIDDVEHTDGHILVDHEAIPVNARKYVAVKVVEHEAAGGASRERVESGLKRELDILKSVHHPCLIRLKAYSIEPSRALLVLPYCPGGDLFDVASAFDLTAPLIRRIFAESVAAIDYLHSNGIVHRDVKLENVLVNLPRHSLAALHALPEDEIYAYPHPITILTDVGLSKRVDFENDELLTTRCGSEDYASPELILGMPYDGRQTDAWALGVMLYALMEGRLPFDPAPGGDEQKMRSKTAHRIARCEWKWFRLAEDADVRLEGGKEICHGLLKRALKRWRVPALMECEWVKGAITRDLVEVPEA